MKKQTLIPSISTGLIVLGLASAADATLVPRLGGLAYYDDVADLTWLADANYAKTSGFDTDGRMTWGVANDWAMGLNIGGVMGWRLPDTIDVGNDGTTYLNGNSYTGVDAGSNMTTHSEMSNLWYNVLGNIPFIDTAGNSPQPGWGLSNTSPFSNIQSNNYWSATEYAPLTSSAAWFFGMHNGNQHYSIKTANSFYGWAVQSGDVSAVPVPAAVWLFGSGLLGLFGVARRKKT